MPPDPDGTVSAPELREVAQTWWDVDVDPAVTWDASGTRFLLVDPTDPSRHLHLLALTEPAEDPRAVATVLAEGLAACDFPPTANRAAPGRVQATLRVAGVRVAIAGE